MGPLGLKGTTMRKLVAVVLAFASAVALNVIQAPRQVSADDAPDWCDIFPNWPGCP